VETGNKSCLIFDLSTASDDARDAAGCSARQ